MTYPRAHLVDPSGGVYHVCSRCVRRAWLCGNDELTGYNFDHRRSWLENRILKLAEIFAIDLYGYAVMSNHYHVVLNLDPARAHDWSEEDIVDRWMTLCPQRITGEHADNIKALRRMSLLKDKERLEVLRQRLSSLSWFMRFVNEPLARRANKEDDCKGRFWEGRFKSQQLLDEDAILAAMIYVDLNPVRAGISEDASDASHTSLKKRLTTPTHRDHMTALNQPNVSLPFAYSLQEYIELADWTVEVQQNKRPSRSYNRGPPHNPDLWLHHYLPKPGYWQRANGSFQSLRDYAKDIGQCWIKTRSRHLQQ
jgi:REP element-mobilizing transposase RayT